jgi:hypothetical protein
VKGVEPYCDDDPIALLRGINVGRRRPFNFAKDQTGLIMTVRVAERADTAAVRIATRR